MKFNEELSKNDASGKKMWGIKKLYTKYNPSKPRTNKFGHKISAYVESIGQYIDEYLVSPSVLKNIMEKAGLIQIKTMSFEEMFKEMRSMPSAAQTFPLALKMSDEEKEYSFMHRMYVFKKNKKPSEDFKKISSYDDTFVIEPTAELDIKSSEKLEDSEIPNVEIKPKITKTVKRVVKKKVLSTPIEETSKSIKEDNTPTEKPKVKTIRRISKKPESVVKSDVAEKPETTDSPSVEDKLPTTLPISVEEASQSKPTEQEEKEQSTESKTKVKKVRVIKKVSAPAPKFTGLKPPTTD